MSTWTPGAPPYISGDKDRALWLILHDQGGHEWVASGWIHGEFGPNHREESAALLAWMMDGRQGERPHQSPLIPYLCVPGRKGDYPLAEWHNIVAWMEAEVPDMPQRNEGREPKPPTL